ncbi:MAG: N-acetylmuramoyl-L-alanine amidase [Myxococcaceae bacterium]|nr:N-acetylmuramoyl-L-alanine amidase [Myxococcaceae bacterium]
MLIRSTLIIACLTALPASAGKPAADEAYESAKAEYTKLKKDEARRALRHHWLNVGKRFDAVAAKHPKTERAPEALFMAGQLYGDLSRLSQNGDDVAMAERAWRKLIDGWPKHRLTDDAALALARLLADRKGDVKAARKVLDATLPNANDKKKDMARLLASLPAPVEPKVKKADKKLEAPKPAALEKVEARALGHVTPARPATLELETPEVADADAPAKKVSALAEALRKLHESAPAPAPNPERTEEAPVAQARRTPPTPRVDAEPAAPRAEADDEAAVVEPGESSVVASLQERLRDVRVGARATDPAAKSRLAALARHQQTDELSLAQQLGLKVRRVVIDAGHGGHDTGAIGPTGVREKDVALAVTQKLKAKLEALGLEVVLTRDDDTFIALDERTRIANREHGDLFISIHCNAAPSRALRGVETYTLNTSSNRYSVRLAARENATTERGINDLQYILADLATKANTGESQRLAERVQRSIVRGLSKDYKGIRDLGTKEALFVVLLGAKMPSILVETSFLSNPEDEQRLASEAYQEALADQIAEAVDGFLDERNKVAQVD